MARRSEALFRLVRVRLTCFCLILFLFLIVGSLRADSGPDIEVQAHRGGRALRPENTLAAFRYAIELGVDTLEADLAVTADRVVVISHDCKLNPAITRCPDGEFLDPSERILIRDLTFAELQRYSVGEIKPRTKYWHRFRDQVPVPEARIPALSELFDLARSLEAERIRFNLEIKTYPTFPEYTVDYREFVDLLLELVADYRLESRVTVQSFDWRTLKRVKLLAPAIPVSCLTVRSFAIDGASYNLQPGRNGKSPWLAGLDFDDYDEVSSLVAAFGGQIVSPYYRDIDEEDVAAAHDLGLKIVPWTVNDPRVMKRLVDWGVDGIISDRPDLLLDLLE